MRVYLIAALLVLTVSVMACADDRQPFKITTKRSDDRVEVKSQDDIFIFDVRSPFGISSAAIERTTEQWHGCCGLVRHRWKAGHKLSFATAVRFNYLRSAWLASLMYTLYHLQVHFCYNG